MGTKLNPGKFDCHAKAEDEEPLFTLLARDPLAHGLVELWAHLRSGSIYEAVFCFGYLCAQVGRVTELEAPDSPKVTEAMSCAADMRTWLADRQA